MTPVLQDQNFDDVATFVAAINRARLANARSWITYVGQVAGRDVRIKTYDAGHLQIFRVDGLEQAAPMDMKPTAWKEFISRAIARVPATA